MILSDEVAFYLMEKKFAELAVHDVLDLCYNGRRYPAVVVDISYTSRSFDYVQLDKDNVTRMLSGIPVHGTQTVILPSDPSEQRPAWNIVGK